MVLGPRVKERRTALGLSQENLAHQAGVSLNAVHKLEAGRITDPHFSTLSGIARALDTTVAELVGEEVRPKAPARSELPQGSEAGKPSDEVAEQTLFEHVNLLKRAADKWQLFIDREYYKLKSMDLEDLEAIDRTDLHIVIVHGRHAAAIKRKATDEQREILEQAEQRLLGTINTFWSAAENYLTVTDLAAVRAEREGWKQVSASDTAGSRAV